MKWYRINALLLKYYYVTINRVDRLFDVVYWPVLDIFLWGFTSFFIEEISQVNVLSMLLGGIILWMFVWKGSQDMAVLVLEDFWSSNLYHVFSSPIKLSENIIAIIIAGFFRSLCSFVVMCLIALLLYSFKIWTINVLFLGLAVFVLSLFGWAVGLFVTGMIYRYGKRIQVMAWSVAWIIQPFSCVFYPLKSLPDWAQKIAGILPTTYIFENMRSSIAQGVVNYAQVGYAFVANVILLVLCGWFLARSFRVAKRSGLIAKAD